MNWGNNINWKQKNCPYLYKWLFEMSEEEKRATLLNSQPSEASRISLERTEDGDIWNQVD